MTTPENNYQQGFALLKRESNIKRRGVIGIGLLASAFTLGYLQSSEKFGIKRVTAKVALALSGSAVVIYTTAEIESIRHSRQSRVEEPFGSIPETNVVQLLEPIDSLGNVLDAHVQYMTGVSDLGLQESIIVTRHGH